MGTLPSGMRVFVPGTVPGDEVEAELVERRASHARARSLRLLEAGQERVETRCPHVERCGGCHLQQLSAAGQLQIKETAFYQALERIGGIPRETIADALGILPSPQPFRYRIRCRLHVARGELGYRGRRSHALEPLEECHLLVPALEALALRLRDHLQAHPLRHLAAVEICVGHDGAGALSLEPVPTAPPGWAKRADELLDVEGVQGVVVPLLPAPVAARPHRSPPPGPRRLPPTVLGDPVVARDAPSAPGVRLLGRPDAFAQANAAANESLVSTAVEALEVQEGEEILELFCGAGNFTFALAARGAQVTAVELEGVSIDLARRAYAATPPSGTGRIRFISGDAGQVVEGFAQEGRHFDRLLLDPPRAGAKELVATLAKLRPKRIAYVSCDPATLARDLRTLGAAGYVPVFARPVDMFPQTSHVEGVVVLEPA